MSYCELYLHSNMLKLERIFLVLSRSQAMYCLGADLDCPIEFCYEAETSQIGLVLYFGLEYNKEVFYFYGFNRFSNKLLKLYQTICVPIKYFVIENIFIIFVFATHTDLCNIYHLNILMFPYKSMLLNTFLNHNIIFYLLTSNCILNYNDCLYAYTITPL